MNDFDYSGTGTALAERVEAAPLAVMPMEVTPEVFKARIDREEQMRAVLKEYVQRNMREGYHYSRDLGGVKLNKPMLLQEGCRNICSMLRLFYGAPVVDEKWLDGDHYRVRVHIALYNSEGHQITSGDGICSTRETKYAYRKGDRKCPECGRDGTIIKGRAHYGGGWVCYEPKGGCKAKFEDNDERITSQQLGRIDNPDKADIENTVLKMAIKRAKSLAVCDVPMVSEIFAPDGDAEPDDAPRPSNRSQSPAPRAATPKQPANEPADDPADLAKLRTDIDALLTLKIGDDQAAIDAFLKGRDINVMPLTALERLKGDLASM